MLQSFSEVPSLPVLSCSSNESSALLWIFFPKYYLDLVLTWPWIHFKMNSNPFILGGSLWSSSLSPLALSSIVHFLKYYSPRNIQLFGVLRVLQLFADVGVHHTVCRCWGIPRCVLAAARAMSIFIITSLPTRKHKCLAFPLLLCGLVISVLINYKFLLVTRSFYFFKRSSINNKVQLGERLVH